MTNPKDTNDLACKEVVELVTDYLEKTLLPEKQTQVDEHLEQCPGCSIYYEQVRQTINVLRMLAEEPVLSGTKEELLQRFRQLRPQSDPGRI